VLLSACVPIRKTGQKKRKAKNKNQKTRNNNQAEKNKKQETKIKPMLLGGCAPTESEKNDEKQESNFVKKQRTRTDASRRATGLGEVEMQVAVGGDVSR
jgi:hypothetical protein